MLPGSSSVGGDARSVSRERKLTAIGSGLSTLSRRARRATTLDTVAGPPPRTRTRRAVARKLTAAEASAGWSAPAVTRMIAVREPSLRPRSSHRARNAIGRRCSGRRRYCLAFLNGGCGVGGNSGVGGGRGVVGGVRYKHGGPCLAHRDLTAHPGMPCFDGFARSVVFRLLLLEGWEQVLGAVCGPEHQRPVVLLVERRSSSSPCSGCPR